MFKFCGQLRAGFHSSFLFTLKVGTGQAAVCSVCHLLLLPADGPRLSLVSFSQSHLLYLKNIVLPFLSKKLCQSVARLT